MKKLFLIILALGMAAGIALPAYSQTFGIEGHLLYAFEFDGDLSGETIEPKDSFGGGGALIFAPSPFLKFDLGVDYLKPKIKNYDIPELSGSKIEMLPLTLGFRVGPSIEPVFLYVGAGIGYSYNDASGGGDWLTLKDCWTYYACLGAELFLTDNLVLRPELRYNWLKPELQVGLFDGKAKEDWKLDHFQGRLGLGLYF